MKRILVTPRAEAALDDILAYTVDRWGEAQADAYVSRLLERVRRLAAGLPPHATPCAALMRGRRRDVGDLRYCREGAHFLILRETPDTLQVIEIFHARMDIERHLQRLADAAGKDHEQR